VAAPRPVTVAVHRYDPERRAVTVTHPRLWLWVAGDGSERLAPTEEAALAAMTRHCTKE
jgi:hypothetical protein